MIADIAFVAGTVHAPTGFGPVATAVAVSGDVISHVGTNSSVAGHIGPGTEVVDLAGRTLLPGFQDAHVHPCTSGVELGRCDLLPLEGATTYLQAISMYAAAHPSLSWVEGKGWAMDAFERGTPTAALLDQAVPDRPAVFVNRDGHGAWVNTLALGLAGITAATPDPRDGRIERDPDGTPSGTLHEGAADLVLQHAPPISQPEIEAGILAAERYLFSLGITAWQDAWVEPAQHAAYLSLAARGELTATVVGALWWDRHRGLDQIAELEARRAETGPGPYRATAVKIMQDGVAENFTAALIEPYLGLGAAPTSNSGLSFIDPIELRQIATALDARGFQLHFHALGDRAVREALDALAAALRANGPSAGRHHLAHLQLVDPADYRRFASLGATANAQPLWAHHDGYQDDLTIPFLGIERAGRQYPWRTLLDSGASLALGSDWDVSTPNPFEILHVAVSRSHPDSRDRPPFFPAERITLDEAIEAYTLGSSYVNHRDDAGAIAVGRQADLVVASRSISEALAEEELAMVTADLTFVAGRLVHER
jgi:hypothetical protein